MKFGRFFAGVALVVAASLSAALVANGAAYSTRVATLSALQALTTAQMSSDGSILLDERTAGHANGGATYLWESSWGGSPDGFTVIAPSDNPGSCSSGCLVATSVILNNGVQSYTVCASSCNYTTFGAALSSLNNTFIPQNINVTINGSAGTYSESGPILWQSSFGKLINLIGTTQTASVTSVVSSSGSAGAWSIVLQLASMPSGIATGQYIGINSASGGTLPQLLDGLFKITAVNSGSSQITVSSTSQYATAPSGAVTATALNFQTILHFAGTDGFQVWSNGTALNFKGIVLEGDNTANTNGLSLQDGDRTFVNGTIGLGIANFGNYELYENLPSEINGGWLYTSGGKRGVHMESGSSMVLNLALIGGTSDCMKMISGSVAVPGTGSTASGCGGNGVDIEQGADFTGNGATFVSTANGGAGYNVVNANLDTSGTSGSNNASGTYSSSTTLIGSLTTGSTVGMTGGTISLNASSNNAVNINTGTSTGTTTVGNTGTLGTLVLAGVGSDTGKSDATVCDVISTHVIYYGSGTGGICLTTSSRDTKHDIRPLTAGLKEILAITPEQFYYKPGFGDGGTHLQFGYIADEVQPILPTLVGHDSLGKPNSVDYGGFVPVLVHAFQQEYAWIAGKFGIIEGEIAALTHRDDTQDREIAVLTREVRALEREHASDAARIIELERSTRATTRSASLTSWAAAGTAR